jgi:Domain of unknown function (DUF4198)
LSKKILLVVVLVTLFLVSSARAHYVWLERDGDGPARAYLGEWVDDIREKIGGMLDRIKAPRVFLGTSTEALPIKRNEDNLEFQSKGRGDIRLVEDSMPPREDKEKGGITKTIYYAKAGRSETAAKLDLEFVPTAPNGSILVLIFRGAPLPKAEVTIVGPSKWQKPLVTNDKGQITLPTPWAGRYVLEVMHFDEKPAGGGNEKFNRTRHISFLSFVHRDGIRWSDKQ